MQMRLRALGTVALSIALALSGALLSGVQAVDYDDSPAATWIPKNGVVYSMVQVGDVVYIGGSFTKLQNPTGAGARVERARLAALDANTGALLSWNPGADSTVRALAAGDDGTIYAGGDFTSVAGRTATRVAAITPTGDQVAGFSASANGTVRAMLTRGDTLFVAGNFDQVNDQSRPGVARLDRATGGLDLSWNAGVGGGRVRALAYDEVNNRLVLGGSFRSLGGQTREYLGSVSPADGAVSPWQPVRVCGCPLLGLDTDGDRVYAAVAGGSGGRAAAWSLNANPRVWVRQGDGDVQTVRVYDGVVYAGGHFGPAFYGAVRHQFVALSASDGALLPYTLPIVGVDDPGIWSILADDDFLRIGGAFRGFSDAPQARYAALPRS